MRYIACGNGIYLSTSDMATRKHFYIGHENKKVHWFTTETIYRICTDKERIGDFLTEEEAQSALDEMMEEIDNIPEDEMKARG